MWLIFMGKASGTAMEQPAMLTDIRGVNELITAFAGSGAVTAAGHGTAASVATAINSSTWISTI